MNKKHIKVLFWLLLSFLILWSIITFFPIYDSGFSLGGKLNYFWLQISNSGTSTGVILIVLLSTLITYLAQGTKKHNLKMSALFLIGFLLTLKLFAVLNEDFLKPALAEPRPSFIKLANRELIDLHQLYNSHSDKENRRIYVGEQLNKAEAKLKVSDIDQKVLDHWVHETGFSLPSGHTQNAFILAMILAYVFYLLPQKALTWLSYLIIFWAILMGLSRVALGVHTPLDVFVGAISGIFIGYLLILTGFIEKLLFHES
ncbi:phosphatase PAP2 family protein [Xanthovirga aplysinae]|uniref:phosphatase PAP2 family protein n=1 Tax=Xanthovirga aplysinae TaxID=2529853 RepID=UPI001656C134|nr:phosphatase PAP2 family protein [Xanthovirga aplysinae]